MHFITLLTLPCVLALPAIQTRQACSGDTVPECDDGAKTWSRCDNGNIVPMGNFDDGWTCDSLRAAYPGRKRSAAPSFMTKRQGCSGDTVPECDDGAKTWSRCDNGNIVPMGNFDDGWTCDSLRAAYPGRKRSFIPSFKAKRQACSGDTVPECDDGAKTWSRCDNGNIVPMGNFDDGWTCDSLRAAYPGRKRELATSTIITSQQTKRDACEGDGVPQCDDEAHTWSRCDNGQTTPMPNFGDGWSCDALRNSFAGQKRSAIPATPAILSKRQGCEGDGVPQCDDASQTWSRCANGVVTPMGTFGAGWSCDALRQAFGEPQPQQQQEEQQQQQEEQQQEQQQEEQQQEEQK